MRRRREPELTDGGEGGEKHPELRCVHKRGENAVLDGAPECHTHFDTRYSVLQAARDGREDVVRQHLARLPKGRKGKVLNGKDSEGYTAVHYAAKFNRFKILQLLVTSGAGERGREGRGEGGGGGRLEEREEEKDNS